MARVEPTGDLVVELRSITDLVQDYLLGDAGRIEGNETRHGAPCVIVQPMPSAPFTGRRANAGTRSGFRNARYAIHCQARGTGSDGKPIRFADITAIEMATLVADYLHQRGWRNRNVPLAQSLEESTGAVVPDPVTRDPTVTVIVSLKAFALANT